MSSVLTTSSLSGTNSRMVGYEKYDPILCLTISGKQNIRLKLKQSEQISGPKVIRITRSIRSYTFSFRWKSKHIVGQLIVS